MNEDTAGTEVVRREDVEMVEEAGRFDMATVDDPTKALEKAETLVSKMAEKCTGPRYVANIQGKDYPKVEWWTTVGASLGLFPQEESCEKLDREGEIAYHATVGVYNGGQRVTRASAICSSEESTWSGRDEYAVRSMAITRATGKAYRLGLSFLAVMADLEPTPAEEMPQNGGSEQGHTCIDLDDKVGFGKHADRTWRELAIDESGYIKWLAGQEDQDKLCDKDLKRLRAAYAEANAEEEPEAPEPGEPLSDKQVIEKARADWITYWESVHGEGTTGERMAWEAERLDPHLLKDEETPDHSRLDEEDYGMLVEKLADEESQTEMEVEA